MFPFPFCFKAKQMLLVPMRKIYTDNALSMIILWFTENSVQNTHLKHMDIDL